MWVVQMWVVGWSCVTRIVVRTHWVRANPEKLNVVSFVLLIPSRKNHQDAPKNPGSKNWVSAALQGQPNRAQNGASRVAAKTRTLIRVFLSSTEGSERDAKFETTFPNFLRNLPQKSPRIFW